MTDKEIIIGGINVSELTGEQLVCMNRYEVARLFAKLVDVLSKTEDNYNNAQEDRVRMWTNNTGLTDKLKRKEQECEKLKNCLTEIKEIAENMNNECFYSDFDCKYCDMKNGCTYHRKIKILQKISEVENDNA